MSTDIAISFLFSIFRYSSPIIFGALAAAICIKAGLLNMAIESMLLFGALGGALAASYGGSAWLGLLGAITASMLVALIISYAAFIGKADLYLTNIAMNLSAVGITVFIVFAITGEKSTTAGVLNYGTLPVINIPLIKDIPVLGRIISGHHILTYIAFVAAVVLYIFISKTRLGLRIRSVGENPHAAQSVGISVVKMQFTAYLISGALAGFGGAALTLQHLTSFTRGMTNGRGYTSLAASTMVDGSPIGSLLTSLLFGASESATISLQNTKIPVDFLEMIPYFVTIVALIVLSVIRQIRQRRVVLRAVRQNKEVTSQ